MEPKSDQNFIIWTLKRIGQIKLSFLEKTLNEDSLLIYEELGRMVVDKVDREVRIYLL